jgi:hypothetical protein
MRYIAALVGMMLVFVNVAIAGQVEGDAKSLKNEPILNVMVTVFSSSGTFVKTEGPFPNGHYKFTIDPGGPEDQGVIVLFQGDSTRESTQVKLFTGSNHRFDVALPLRRSPCMALYCPEKKVGEVVAADQEALPLRVGSTTVASVGSADVLRVRRVSGDWLWVSLEQSPSSVRGWVRADEVRRIDQLFVLQPVTTKNQNASGSMATSTK